MDSDDVRRIAFVTRRFGELQGLVTVAEGAGLLVGALLAQYAIVWAEASLLPLIAGTASAGVVGPYFTQAYRESFGAVAPQRRWGRMPLMLLVVQVGLAADFLLGGSRGPSIGACAVILYSALVVVRDAPWRTHYLVPLVAGGVGVSLSTAVPAASLQFQWLEPFDPARGQGFVLAYAVIGLGVLVAGALDHHLLVEALSPQSGVDARTVALAPPFGKRDAVARAANGPLRALLSASVAVATGLAIESRHLMPVIWMTLFLVFMLVFPMAISIDTYKGRMRQRPPRSLTSMVGAADVVSLCSIGAAATLDLFIGPGRVSLLALAFAGACLWVVVRDWPLRPHYLLGCVTALFSAWQFPGVATAADTMGWAARFLFLASASLAVEGVFDYWVSKRVRAHGGVHADAV